MKTPDFSSGYRPDKAGRNTILSLDYYSGFCLLSGSKKYLDMNIHERITMRTAYCGRVFPSICIMDLIKFNNETNEKSN